MKKYEAKPGAWFDKKKVDIYGKEIDSLKREHHNFLPTQIIVDAARKKDSPLHDAFEWDDTVAAEAFRRKQAVDLVNHIIVIKIDQRTGEERREPLAISVKISDEKEDGEIKRAYTSVEIAVKDFRDQIKQELLSELIRIKQKIKEFEEFAEVYGAIEKVEKQLNLETGA